MLLLLWRVCVLALGPKMWTLEFVAHVQALSHASYKIERPTSTSTSPSTSTAASVGVWNCASKAHKATATAATAGEFTISSDTVSLAYSLDTLLLDKMTLFPNSNEVESYCGHSMHVCHVTSYSLHCCPLNTTCLMTFRALPRPFRSSFSNTIPRISPMPTR